jgi:hypothetical protein
MFSGLPTATLFVSTRNCFLVRQRLVGAEEVIAKDESTDRDIEKWFPGMLPKALRTLAKVCNCPRELL